MADKVHRIELPATREQLAHLRAGDEVALFGTIYTMRDAGHARALAYLEQHGELPYHLAGQALFYAGPTPAPPVGSPAAGQPFGAIGPTTASRMDFATPALLAAGVNVVLGKGVRSPDVITACKATSSVYLAATGGAAALLASYVTASELVAWEDLGTEALRRLTLNGLPAFVAIDTLGGDLYTKV
jgi:fumarate hydratase class I/fumarate hydratase subunit beta